MSKIQFFTIVVALCVISGLLGAVRELKAQNKILSDFLYVRPGVAICSVVRYGATGMATVTSGGVTSMISTNLYAPYLP